MSPTNKKKNFTLQSVKSSKREWFDVKKRFAKSESSVTKMKGSPLEMMHLDSGLHKEPEEAVEL